MYKLAPPYELYAWYVATLAWMLVFGARFVVQRLLYDAGQTGWLAVARIGMGWPLTVLAAVVTYGAAKAAQRAIAAAGEKAVDEGPQVEADPVVD